MNDKLIVTVPAARREAAAAALKFRHVTVVLDRWADELNIEYEFLIKPNATMTRNDVRAIVGHPCRVEETQ